LNVYAGLDIGGTSMKCMLLDAEKQPVDTASFPTCSIDGMERAVDTISEEIGTMLKNSGGVLCSLGIGCSGPLNIKTGVIENPYTLPGFEGHSLTMALRERLQVPVLLENDANTAHVGEIASMNVSPDNSIMLTFGTGVGCSIRLDGKIFRLPGGVHPEIGHIPVGVDANIPCYCGKTACLENVLSGTAINRDAQLRFASSPEDVLRTQGADKEKEKFRKRLVKALADAVLGLSIIFHPQIIIIGGGIQDLLVEYIIPDLNCLLERLLQTYGKTRLIPARKGSLAGCYGAALMAYTEE